MKTVDVFPLDAATGACLVTRKSDPKKIGPIVVLDADMEDMPRFGGICISQKGVELLVTQLGLKLAEIGEGNTVAMLHTANAELRAECAELRAALRNVLAAAELVGVELEVAPELVEVGA
jgi:hypothetical protein